MGQLFCRGALTIVAGLVGATLSWSGAMAQGEPPGRVARLAFTNGTVSFHADQQSGWTTAVVNTPLTTGDSLWTEPNAHSEISLAGTRIRMDSATQLDMLALDDQHTRLQLTQGRIDLKTLAMDANQPFEVVTPRGTIALQQQGDYYVEAGSTEDPTRLGVRSGAAQIQSLNGQVIAVHPGEVAEVVGDANAPQLRTVTTAPPAPPAYWASRDRQVVYDPPQYLSAAVTGYEDLNAYGSWVNDGSYGEVWVPRAAPSGWAPYRTGHWSYVQPWGWTWIDEQPWGFAPYHYGRWANSNNRWVWVPPQRDVRPVYAPALVAFVGGVELAATLGNRSSAPVGWFPLGPREVYVPPYTTNRDYYQRLNRSARIEDRVLEDRWQRAERHEAVVAGQNQALVNQRFATVVPTTAFVSSQPVMRAALQVPQRAIVSAPVAPVAAPPAPTMAVVSAPAAPVAPATSQSRGATVPASPQTTPVDPRAQADAKARAEAALKTANVPIAKTAVADMPTLARPTTTARPAAPGPKFAATQPQAPTEDKATPTPAAPTLVPRPGAAPPVLKGAVTPAPTQPIKPGEPPRQQQAAPQPQAAPPTAPAPVAQPKPEVAKPAEPARQQASAPPLPAPQQARPAESPKPKQSAPATAAQPQQARPEPPKQPQAAPPPVRTAPSPQQQEGRARPMTPVEPARPQAAPQVQAPPQQPAPQRQAAPAPQQQVAPQQHQAPPPQQHQAAPAPQQQHQAPPPPQPAPQQAQSHPAPQQQQHPAPQQKADEKK